MVRFFRNSYGEGYVVSGFGSRSTLVFFGNASLEFEILHQLWPQLQFVQTRQVHGSQIISVQADCSSSSHSGKRLVDLSEYSNIEGDGMLTSDSSLGLVIKTADCVPVFLVDPRSNQIAAVHSGWRGFSKGIIQKAIDLFGEPRDLLAFSGPCIGSQSYEVQWDVIKNFELYDSCFSKKNRPKNINFQDPQDQKFFLNLKELLRLQLKEKKVEWYPRFHSQKDTFLEISADSKKNLHSYRRDSVNAGRNLSFVAHL